MRSEIFVIALVATLLFGCFGGGDGGEVSPTATPPAGNGGTEPTQAPTQGGGSDLSGLGYMELAALGAPVECTYTMHTPERDITYQMKIRGENIYMEGENPANPELPYYFVVKDNKMYMVMDQYTQMAFAKECDWLLVESQGGDGGSAYDTTELENTPPTDFSCRPGTFGDEAFATPGTVCTMADMAGAMPPSG